MGLRAPFALVCTANIRRTPGAEWVEQGAAEARRRFAEARKLGAQATHVIIPSYNEQDDLPATLVALSRNQNVLPVVVTNNCTDRTAEIAGRMGADLVDQPTGKKMAATKAGIAHVLGRGAATVLATDADTLVTAAWATHMTSGLDGLDQGYGAAIFGNSLSWHGKSMLADTAISALHIASGVRARRKGRPPAPFGHNYGLRFDPDGVMYGLIREMDDTLFAPGANVAPDDRAIQEGLLAGSHAAVGGLLAADSYVVTRGDRITAMSQVWRIVVRGEPYFDVVAGSYAAQYAPLAPPAANRPLHGQH